MIDSNATGGISGVVYAGQTPREPPQILVVGDEKTGKSSLTTTLFDWPYQGCRPFVIAADSTGVESCAQLGFPVAHVKVKNAAGANTAERMDNVVKDVCAKWQPVGPTFPFSSVVIDCVSTYSELLLTEDMAANPSPDPRRNYGNILPIQKRLYWDLYNLGVPVIWLGWRRPPNEITTGSGAQKKTTREPGGLEVPGKFRKILAGWVHQIFILEMKKVGLGVQGADKEGFSRVLHSRSHDGVIAGGRWQTLLPNPAPPHLGYLLNLMLGINPQQ